LKAGAAGAAAALLNPMACKSSSLAGGQRKPNIVFILADDLGYAELGCYGQKKIRTPNIDRLAREGMRFTQHYSGSPVCAPSRCTLLTGKHTGHCYIRDNDEMRERGDVWNDQSLQGQRPLKPGTETLGTMLQRAGYVTGAIGKWGLGGPNDTGQPNKQGFDFFYGYLCQRVAHNFYPDHLWRNEEKVMLEGNTYFRAHQKLPEDKDPDDPASYAPYSGKQYSFDLMMDEALGFIRKHQEQPFFLYLPFTIPHVALQVPEDSLAEYEGAFPETPYKGGGYLPHRTPRAAYAAMITRMDRGIGRIMALLDELGLDDDTLVIFTSDNGPTFAGGADSKFFESAGPLRGLKCDVYEGGIRVPFVARWPGRIPAGTTTDHVSAFWDVMPTFADITGAKAPKDTDGISMLPTLCSKGKQQEHEYLYWEYFGRPSQAVRMGDWKGVRLKAKKNPGGLIELYNLKNDIGEKNNIADVHPQVKKKIEAIMASRTPSEFAKWNFKNK
jgi:arylsulfatase